MVEDEKSKCLVKKCLPCFVESFKYRMLSLVIALFLVQTPFLISFTQFRGRLLGLDCFRLRVIFMPEKHI